MKQPTPRDIIYGNIVPKENSYKVTKTAIKEKERLLGDFGVTNSVSMIEKVRAALSKAKTTIELDRIALNFIDMKLGYR